MALHPDIIRALQAENITRLTGNMGHDVARANTASMTTACGFNTEDIREYIMQHPTVKLLREKKACRIVSIYGDNFMVFCVDSLYTDVISDNKHALTKDNGVTVVQVVSNIIKSYISSHYNLENYGCTQYWKNYPNNKVYKKVIHVGADVMTLSFINGYNQPYKAKLSEYQKRKIYL